MSAVGEAVHSAPVWRDRSDFIIATPVEPGESGVSTEQLWARRVDDQHYELCCIPFFAYDLALGDVVEVDPEYLVTRVSKPSGRYVFRAYFGRSAHPQGEILDRLTELGALVEWSSATLLAIDAADLSHAQQLADFLQEREALGQLLFETGRSA